MTRRHHAAQFKPHHVGDFGVDIDVCWKVADFRDDDLAILAHTQRADQQFEQVDRDGIAHDDLVIISPKNACNGRPCSLRSRVPIGIVPAADQSFAPFLFHSDL